MTHERQLVVSFLLWRTAHIALKPKGQYRMCLFVRRLCQAQYRMHQQLAVDLIVLCIDVHLRNCWRRQHRVMAIIQYDCACRVLPGGLGTGRVGFCVCRWLLVLFGLRLNHSVLQLVLGEDSWFSIHTYICWQRMLSECRLLR